jgi:hypothetical protein
MNVKNEDALRKHLDAVDRMERKFKLTTALAALTVVVGYGSFFYLAGRADIRLVLMFVVVSLSAGMAAVANALHLRIAQTANRILKAIELSARDSER